MIEILGEQREMTRDNVERKQARTEDERIEDEDDEFIEEEEEGKSSFSLKCPYVRFQRSRPKFLNSKPVNVLY